jgi:hypothetical protein
MEPGIAAYQGGNWRGPSVTFDAKNPQYVPNNIAAHEYTHALDQQYGGESRISQSPGFQSELANYRNSPQADYPRLAEYVSRSQMWGDPRVERYAELGTQPEEIPPSLRPYYPFYQYAPQGVGRAGQTMMRGNVARGLPGQRAVNPPPYRPANPPRSNVPEIQHTPEGDMWLKYPWGWGSPVAWTEPGKQGLQQEWQFYNQDDIPLGTKTMQPRGR